MYEYLIQEYLNKTTEEDIINYGKKNNVIVSNKDAKVILNYAKKYYKVFLNGDPTSIFKDLKNKLEPKTYQEVYKIYITYKLKYLK